MNTIERLQQASNSDIRDITFQGVPLRIRRMGAQDGIQLHKLTPQAPYDDPAQLTALYVFAISKSLVDEAGNLDCDTDQDRERLSAFPLQHLIDLGEQCITFGGPDNSKKNESGAKSSDSDSASVSPSESPTPTS